ncbi:twin-arginine translocase TatA/TatE family subunit [Rhodococcus pyridinivorans]|uniref:Sec-independent protein translocase protein TatA n=2 Tax=Rhodococcus TaxID=1827 RepID=H0JKL9_9NOCA|nr:MULTISPECIES: twin-arginine translocase TatA/TatE family subunit [Rhodococcus]AOD23990.1 Sec-independent secretion protein [Rhodococcus sp. p52]AWZ25976.1 Sec-independent protein translocase TatA [Rhodococcus pyridinivorans]EHK86204.1 Sec-independent protein [Rhodococcus pyridinivorans AK37]MCD2139708.1 twin-arginine translocase TatA/TatE family subunit [Rhodococcus pyridinivorans]MCW3470314.1 twin-arginine translocase TatA/TatE family subunit [Rhodococcus pyridinivorans]
MLHNLTGWHALIVLAILLLVFGAAKLPALAKGVGQSLRILKDEIREESTPSPQDNAPTALGEHSTTTVTSTPVPYRPAS